MTFFPHSWFGCWHIVMLADAGTCVCSLVALTEKTKHCRFLSDIFLLSVCVSSTDARTLFPPPFAFLIGTTETPKSFSRALAPFSRHVLASP